jgi:hypothetical protein
MDRSPRKSEPLSEQLTPQNKKVPKDIEKFMSEADFIQPVNDFGEIGLKYPKAVKKKDSEIEEEVSDMSAYESLDFEPSELSRNKSYDSNPEHLLNY